MTATITPVTRNHLGLVREVYLVKCNSCSFRTEFRHARIAEAIRANHVCREDAQ